MSSFEPIPEPVANAARFMSGYERPWALCGGWAADAWLGRVTRSHLDIDIALPIDDATALYAHLSGWNFVAHDAVQPDATHPWDGRPLSLPAHLHARPPGAENLELLKRWVTPPGHEAAKDGSDFDFEFSALEDANWVLRDEPRILRPIGEVIGDSPWRVPTVVASVVAFYKATAYYRNPRFWGDRRPHDLADFDLLAAELAGPERLWLTETIAAHLPDHPWLPRLE